MTIDEIRAGVNIRLNKDTSGQSLTTDEFNIIAQIVNLEYFKLNYGLPEEYTKNAPYSSIQWEVSSLMSDRMNPFLVSMNGRDKPFLKVDANGFATIPSDYFHQSSFGYDYMTGTSTKRRVVEIITNAQWESRLGSRLVMPTKRNPICKFLKGKIEFAPRDLGVVAFSYLRKPATPFYAVTEDAATEDEIYDATNSVQFEWPDVCHTDLLNMIVSYAADNLRDQFAKQSAEARKMQGL